MQTSTRGVFPVGLTPYFRILFTKSQPPRAYLVTTTYGRTQSFIGDGECSQENGRRKRCASGAHGSVELWGLALALGPLLVTQNIEKLMRFFRCQMRTQLRLCLK